MEYKIAAVSDDVKTYDSKYGQMKQYKVKFDGVAEAVSISQKATSPAPVVGSTLTGSIQDTEYGKKFKKEYNQGGFSGGSGGFKGKSQSDNFTMFLSYAKDLAVTMLQLDGEINDKKFEKVLEQVANAGTYLYEHRPGQTPAEITGGEEINLDKEIEWPADL